MDELSHVPEPTDEQRSMVAERVGQLINKIFENAFQSVGITLEPESGLVYQYTDIGALRGMITNNELWSTPVGYLNDASEHNHGRDLLLGHISEVLQGPLSPSLTS
jgi:hypothetical protein